MSMRLGRSGIVAVFVLAGVLAGACSVSNPSSNVTDTFSGTVTPGGTKDVYLFTVSKSGGEYSIKLTALAPDSGATLGVSYGSLSGSDCLTIQQTGLAALNKTALSGTINKGNYCLAVFDNGLNQRAESYTITVSHP
jgi:hypothetical protein